MTAETTTMERRVTATTVTTMRRRLTAETTTMERRVTATTVTLPTVVATRCARARLHLRFRDNRGFGGQDSCFKRC